MKTLIFIILYVFILPIVNAQNNETTWRASQSLEQLKAAPAALIPFPGKAGWTPRNFTVRSDVTIACFEIQCEDVQNAARSLREILTKNGLGSRLQKLKASVKVPANSFLLRLNDQLAVRPEGYSIEISTQKVVITGRDAAGAFYAVQTIRQLLDRKGKVVQLPGGKILDEPAFSMRGFMHDTGRNFQEIESLKKQLDILAAYKFNTFHWHLTDNPAWRPQSRIYPQLNESKNRKAGRDPERSYSFDDIRELVRYARERHIKIIPELDMPGHSEYFEPTFGFKMHSEQGMKVLEDLIDEFCREFPATDFPIIHIGSDEVRIPNPDEFIRRMTAKLNANERKAMVWNPGLKGESGTIEQLWSDAGTKAGKRTDGNPFVDSYAGYLNSYDALTLTRRYFFQQIGNRPLGDKIALGGILCMWPDVRVENKRNIFQHNPVWPGTLAYSEAIWSGRPSFETKYMGEMPPPETEAGKQFAEFEQRLALHRDRFFKSEPFPFVRSSHVRFRMLGPFTRGKDEPAETALSPETDLNAGPAGTVKTVYGGVFRIDDLIGKPLQSDAVETVYLESQIFSRRAKQIRAWIGFETPTRSSRKSAGIPFQGKWDANGGTIFVNGKELEGPQWQNPGGNRYLQETWFLPANEIPYTDEEFYWSRDPASIRLKQGWNRVLIRIPRSYPRQNWMAAFVPVRFDKNGRWIEDMSVSFR